MAFAVAFAVALIVALVMALIVTFSVTLGVDRAAESEKMLNIQTKVLKKLCKTSG